MTASPLLESFFQVRFTVPRGTTRVNDRTGPLAFPFRVASAASTSQCLPGVAVHMSRTSNIALVAARRRVGLRVDLAPLPLGLLAHLLRQLVVVRVLVLDGWPLRLACRAGLPALGVSVVPRAGVDRARASRWLSVRLVSLLLRVRL